MLPPLFAGDRVRTFFYLFGVGIGQAVLALAVSFILSRMMAAPGTSDSIIYTMVLVAAALLTIALRSKEFALAERLGQSYVLDARLLIFRRSIELSHAEQRHGIAMTRLITDLASLKNWISKGIAGLLVSFLAIAGGLAALWLLVPNIAWIATLPVACVLLVGLCLAPILRTRTRRARRYRGRLAARLGELLLARATLLQFGAIDVESDRLKRTSRKMAASLAGRRAVAGAMSALPELLIPVTAGALAIQLALGQTTTAAEFILALLILGFIAQPLRTAIVAIDFRIAFLEGRARIRPLLMPPSLSEQSSPAAKQPYRRDAESESDSDTSSPARRAVPEIDITTMPPPSAALIARNLQRVNDSVEACALAMASEDDTNRLLAEGDMRRIRVAPGVVREVPIETAADADAIFKGIAGLVPLSDDIRVHLDGHAISTLDHAERRRTFQLLSPDVCLLRRSAARNLRDLTPAAPQYRLMRVWSVMGLDTCPEISALGKRRLDERGHGLSPEADARLRLARAIVANPTALLVNDPAFISSRNLHETLQLVASHFQLPVLTAKITSQDDGCRPAAKFNAT